MWIEVKKANCLMIAQMWQDLLEGESIPTLLLPEKPGGGGEFASYCILVPQFRETVAQEVLRKL